LPWPEGALAPALSAGALRYHHGHHHAAYLATVRRLTAGSELADASLEQIIRQATGPLVNAAAQAWNHEFYWASMAPAATRPDAALLRAINASFGSRAALARRFQADGVQLFGSGWVWLVAEPDATLAVVATPNAGLRVHEAAVTPLLVCDVWEHAYYVDYRGDRAAYIAAFWGLVDWRAASTRFAAARAAGGSRPRRGIGRASPWADRQPGEWLVSGSRRVTTRRKR
jgi:superoxide dismutase, Fe-Mn family